MSRAAVATLGCKVNRAESEALATALAARGFDIVPFGAPADAYIVNSCTVTAQADHKSRRLVRAALRRNPDALVVLAGCYATEAERRAVPLPPQIVLVPNARKDELARLIADRTPGREERPHRVRSTAEYRRTRVTVKVQDGCDSFCRYCVVPLARGAPKSRPAEAVIAEVEHLVAAHVPEVVVTGINLGRYRSSGLDLSGLVERILDTGVARLRLSSVEPPDVGARLIEVIARRAQVCPHLHVPLQSGSDAVLARMARCYRADDFRRLAHDIMRVRSDMALTTDVMVGFPGETEDDVDATIELLRDVAPLKLHVFKYSERPGTRAASMTGQIDPETKAIRAARLSQLDVELATSYVTHLVGRELEVVVEKAVDGRAEGLAGNYVRCIFKGDAALRGTIVPVRAVACDGRALVCEQTASKREERWTASSAR